MLRSSTEPTMVLCEGAHDREFLSQLLRHREIGRVEVFSVEDITRVRGNRAFDRALAALAAAPGFETLRTILIVTDSDDDPHAAFAEAAAQIGRTPDLPGPPGRRYPVPAAPLVVAPGPPDLAIVMIPGTDRPGTLETLCLEIAADAAPDLLACVDIFAQCASVDRWSSRNKRDKMRFRSLIAAGHEANPELSPARLWSDGPGHRLIPLDHPAFDPIADFIHRIATP